MNAKNRILLIEDKSSLSDSLCTLLELHGYAVTVAANGQEGVNKARARQPDLVISDIFMPVMNGYELLEHFRQDACLCHVPIVMLTARSETEEINTAMRKGAAGYITKPFLFRDLHAVIRGILL